MSVQADLESRVARERKRVTELRNEIIRREAFVQGLEAALNLLSADRPQDLGESLRSGSDVSKAQQLLSVTKRPLHISDILKGIGKEDTKQNRASLGSSLARYARKGEVFQRGRRPNEFTLIGDNSPVAQAPMEDAPEDSAELPAIFGSGIA